MNRPTAYNNRRRFISNTLKLALLAGIFSPVEQSCNNNRDKKLNGPSQPDKKLQPNKKTNRKKWNYEKLVMNSKTNVMHFPTSKVYAYYDEIAPKHIQDISLAAWATMLQEPARLNKDQSGNILEILTLQSLAKGVNDDSLSASANTLSRAFSPACENAKNINPNTTNFRLHELMLQLIALNNTIPAAKKWQAFNEKVKKPEALRKRQKWMETETNFNERIKYILDRQNDYTTRLTQRAAKYSFT